MQLSTTFKTIVVIHVIDSMHQFKMLNRFMYTSEMFSPLLGVRWIGLDVGRNADTHRGSD